MSSHKEFLKKKDHFERLIQFCAKRLHIPGVLDQEDLYQEGLLILNAMFVKYDVSPDSEDFNKLFKTELWHRLTNITLFYKRSKRDYRKIDHSVKTKADREDSDFEGRNPMYLKFLEDLHDEGLTPEDAAIENQESVMCEEVLDMLNERLDDESLEVLFELVVPRDADEIPLDAMTTQRGDAYWRRPRKSIPKHTLARMLGMPSIRIRRAIKRIKVAVLEVADELGAEKISARARKELHPSL